MKVRGLVIATVVAFSVLVFASPALAEMGDMQVRFGVLYSIPMDESTEGVVTNEFDSTLGFQAGFEFGVTDLIGVEAGLSSVDYDISQRAVDQAELDWGDIDVLTLAVSANFHVIQSEKIDLFLGPSIGYAFWGDLKTVDSPQEFPADDEFVYGVNAGIDLPLGDGGWAIGGTLRYTFSDVSLGGGSSDLGVDPLELGVGFSYSF